MRLLRYLLVLPLLLSLTLNAYADADKKLTLKDVQGKVQSLAKSVSKTIDSLKKSNAASKDLKGQVKKLGETIKVFESQLAQIEKGGEIYKLVIEAQEGISGNIKMFESKILELPNFINLKTRWQ